MKFLFFGLGSIGLRHARILKDIGYDDIIAYRTYYGQEKNNLNIKEINNIYDALNEKPDIIFITNPTSEHIKIIKLCVDNNIPFFVEKPISNSMEDVIELKEKIKNMGLFSYVGYNMRFNKIILELKEIINKNGLPIYFNTINSSSLKNWRKNQDYKKSYSSKNIYGGGVTLDLSHDFDYITYLFGEISKIYGYIKKVSNLEIDSDDISVCNIILKNGIIGSTHLDYFGFTPENKICMYYNDKKIVGDFLNNEITINGKIIKKLQIDRDDMYREQLIYFIEKFKKDELPMNNFNEASKLFERIIYYKKCFNKETEL